MISLGQISYEGDFFDISRTVQNEFAILPDGYYANYIAEIELTFDEQVAIHERQAYGILDILGDLGGVLEIIMGVFGILIFPYTSMAY